MDYIKPGFTLPVPLNLIPTPVTFYFSIRSIWNDWKQNRDMVVAASGAAVGNRNNSSGNQLFDDLTIHNEMRSQGSLPNLNAPNNYSVNGVPSHSTFPDLNHKVRSRPFLVRKMAISFNHLNT